MSLPADPGILAERAPIPIVGIDREGAVTYVNDSLCALTGLRREEMLGQCFWAFVGGRRGEALRERFLMARDEELFRRFDMAVRREDGDTRVIAWHNVPFRDDDGRLVELFSVGSDVTGLRRAQTRLGRLYTTLDALGQISRLALRTKDPRELLDRAADILVGTRTCVGAWITLIGDDGQPIGLIGAPDVSHGEVSQAGAGPPKLPSCVPSIIEGPYEFTISELSETCRECPFAPSDSNVQRVSVTIGHGDHVYAVMGAHVRDAQLEGEEVKHFFRAIAEDLGFTLAMHQTQALHKRAERALESQGRMMDAFFEASLDPAAILDRDFNFLRVNRAYAAADERSPDEFIGLNHFDLYPNGEVRRIFERVRDTAEPYEARARIFVYPEAPERGNTYWDWTLVPILGDDGEVEMLSFWLRNVTDEFIAHEELKRSQESLRQLGAQLAKTEQRERRQIATTLHDSLGQTLAFSKMKLASLTQSGSADPESIRQVIEFIDEAIGFTRSLTTQLSPPVLNGMGLIPALEWLSEDLGEKHNVCIKLLCTDDPGRLKEEVEATLFQATRELLFNAIKHANPRQVKIECTANDCMVHVVVEDDGAGFDPRTLRGPTSPQEAGFGLFNVEARIGYLGGEVEIHSEPGAGTTIRLHCPRGDKETM